MSSAYNSRPKHLSPGLDEPEGLAIYDYWWREGRRRVGEDSERQIRRLARGRREVEIRRAECHLNLIIRVRILFGRADGVGDSRGRLLRTKHSVALGAELLGVAEVHVRRRLTVGCRIPPRSDGDETLFVGVKTFLFGVQLQPGGRGSRSGEGCRTDDSTAFQHGSACDTAVRSE